MLKNMHVGASKESVKLNCKSKPSKNAIPSHSTMAASIIKWKSD